MKIPMSKRTIRNFMDLKLDEVRRSLYERLQIFGRIIHKESGEIEFVPFGWASKDDNSHITPRKKQRFCGLEYPKYYREVAEAFKLAIWHDPALSDAHLALATTYQKLGEQDCAREQLAIYNRLVRASAAGQIPTDPFRL